MKKIRNLIFSLSTMLMVSSFSGCSFQKNESIPNNIEKNKQTRMDFKLDDTINNNFVEPEKDSFQDNKIAVVEEQVETSTPLLSPTPSTENTEIIKDDRKLIALTFDDGPSKYTEELLEVLDKHNIKATFFVLGCNCDNYPDALIKIADSGHEIAIHGDTHTSFTKLNTNQVDEEITNTINYIESLGLNPTELVRPPYGSLNQDIKENIEYPFILWNIDTEDWKTKDKEKIKAEILDNIQEGSIILMHDTKSVHNVDIEVLEEILPDLTAEYDFVTISELCENFNIELENGKAYRKIKSEN